MWKVLGVDTVLIKAGDVWEARLLELSKRKKDAERFRFLMAKGEVNYWFDAVKEIHAFYIQFPKNVGQDDLEFLKEFILKVQKGAKVPVVEYEGTPQQHIIVLTSAEDEDLHKHRRSPWEDAQTSDE